MEHIGELVRVGDTTITMYRYYISYVFETNYGAINHGCTHTITNHRMDTFANIQAVASHIAEEGGFNKVIIQNFIPIKGA